MENKRNRNALFPALRPDVLEPGISAADWVIFEVELGCALETLPYAFPRTIGNYEFALDGAERKSSFFRNPQPHAPYCQILGL